MPTNQNEEFAPKFVYLMEDHFANISKNICPNTCNDTAIKANFHFSHCESMENLSCHSNKKK